MAFASAFRRILNGSSMPSLNIRSQFSSTRLSSSLPPLISSRLYVSGLSDDTNDEILYKAFEKFGKLLQARVIRENGKSKRCGFVTYATMEDAERARQEMNARFIDGSPVFIDPATPTGARRQPPPR